MLESILADVYKHLELQAIPGKGEHEGHFLLRISESIEVWVKDLNPGVYIYCNIAGNVNRGQREDFYSYLMKANFLGTGTGGSIIGLHPGEKFLTLALPINYEVNYKIFRDKLEEFLNYLEYWRKEIKEYEARQL